MIDMKGRWSITEPPASDTPIPDLQARFFEAKMQINEEHIPPGPHGWQNYVIVYGTGGNGADYFVEEFEGQMFAMPLQ